MKYFIVNNKKINRKELIEVISKNEGQSNIFECVIEDYNKFICTLVKNGSIYEVDNEKQLFALNNIIDLYCEVKIKYHKNSITYYEEGKEVLTIRSIQKPETPADTIEKIINDLNLETGKDFSYYFNIIKENNIEKDSLQAEVIKYHLFKYGNPSITALVSWCDKHNLNKDLPVIKIKHQVANIIYQRILNDLNDGQMIV